MDDATRRRELADFLRSRRERIGPGEFGLPLGPRRRTPGLRREEVAQLAGVGVTWYTWLEQGRRINVSAQVLGAIARTLRLDAPETAHLFHLAGAPEPAVASAPVTALPPPGLATLDALSPFPAYVATPRYDILAFNTEASELLGDLVAVPPHRRNVMWLAFTSGELRHRVLDYERAAAWHVATFRMAMGEHSGEPGWTELRDELRERSPEFRRLWDRHDVDLPRWKLKRFRHPEAGRLTLVATSMYLVDVPHARMVVYTPTDEASAMAVQLLAIGRPTVGKGPRLYKKR